jgi:hypothetical protein
VVDAGAGASVLVIGEPACDPNAYPRLPGAREEAEAVAQRLSIALGADRVTALIGQEDTGQDGPDAQAVIGALLGRDWRIVHVAGHGALPEKIGQAPRKAGDPSQVEGDPRGVVLSDGTFLGPREVGSMRKVPELVFVNCCHLAARNAAELLTEDSTRGAAPPDRPRFAAGARHGQHRCVLCRCRRPSTTARQKRHRFLRCAAARPAASTPLRARQDAWELGGNTWAAYQCYGDPDWRLRPDTPDAQRPDASIADEFIGVASAQSLELALETLAVKSRFQRAPAAEQQGKIRHLEAKFAPRWRHIGAVAEGFARAWDEAGERAAAIEWYTRALGPTTTASLRASSSWQPSPRQAWERGEAARLSPQSAAGAGARARLAQGRSGKRAGRTCIDARAAFDAARAGTNLQPTISRKPCGAAWKHMASGGQAETAGAEAEPSQHEDALRKRREARAREQRSAALLSGIEPDGGRADRGGRYA